MDYEREDGIATVRGRFAVECAGKPPVTVMEAAAGLDVRAPRTEDDLRTLKAVCQTWGIRVNIDTEPCWTTL